MKSSTNLRKFILLWAGELISSIGGGLTSFGLGVYIFQQTGSAAGMALITLLGFLPVLLLSVPAGVLADRYDRRLLMMIGDGCSALGVPGYDHRSADKGRILAGQRPGFPRRQRTISVLPDPGRFPADRQRCETAADD